MKRIGLVLEGGGTRGAYQAGAIKAIREEGLEICGVTGTSVGAINGAFLVLDRFDELYKMYEDLKPDLIIDSKSGLTSALAEQKLNFVNMLNLAQETFQSKGFDVTPMRTYLDNMIDEEEFRASKIAYGLVFVDIADRKNKELLISEIPQGKLVDYIMASSHLPVFAGDHFQYLDGGFANNIPLDLLLRSGTYDHIYILRTASIGRHQSLKRDVSMDVLNPSEELGNVLQFDPERVRHNLQMGYYDMLRLLRGYAGELYTIESIPEEFFYKSFVNARTEDLDHLRNLMSATSKKNPRRFFFEDVIRYLQKSLGLKSDDSYENIGLRLLENLASHYGVDRFRVYSLTGFLEEIRSRRAESEAKSLGLIDKLQVFVTTKSGISIGENPDVLNACAELLLGGKDGSETTL